jgi:hypothetical protein
MKFLIGAGIIAALLWGSGKPASFAVGEQVTYASGGIVAQSAELYARMDGATKAGYAMGAANADLAITDTLACEEAAKMGLRGAMQTDDPVTKLYYAFRDNATGALDC